MVDSGAVGEFTTFQLLDAALPTPVARTAATGWGGDRYELWSRGPPTHCHTLAGGTPILALDMYEHSYHIDFGAKAGSYVDTFMSVIRWQTVDQLFRKLADESGLKP